MRLTATDLTCDRNGQALFAPVNFVLDPGTAILLQGPNGVGKTTLLRAIAGLGHLSGGTVTLDEVPLSTTEGALAYSGHLDAIKPALTVRENLSFWAALHNSDNLEDTLTHFALSALATRPAGRLSAGQKRRLGLARMALSNAKIWLMDEPTVSLDQASTSALGTVISAHLANGGSALIATHLPLPINARPLQMTPATPKASADPFLTEGAL